MGKGLTLAHGEQMGNTRTVIGNGNVLRMGRPRPVFTWCGVTIQ
jgi:hypothetical protein